MISVRRPNRWRFAVALALIGGAASLLLFSLIESETGVSSLDIVSLEIVSLKLAVAAPPPQRSNPRLPPPPQALGGKVRRYSAAGITNWWDHIPEAVKRFTRASGDGSNVRPSDYTGPESCKECHEENYELWSEHPHRWMNTLATESTVKGDFSGGAKISYLGGQGRFFRDGNEYRMELVRGDLRRLYEITQTIGSRFYQYYVGKQLEGPEPYGHVYYAIDYVLPFGYHLTTREWVPVVHLTTNDPWDGQEEDPYEHGPSQYEYSQCNYCHTTMPLGDQLFRIPGLIGRHAPFNLHWFTSAYMRESRPEFLEANQNPVDLSDQEINDVRIKMVRMEGPDHAVVLGVSCEACHLGSKEHALEKREKPAFLPMNQHLLVEPLRGQTNKISRREALNWTCGRCHSGNRLQYAAGMATWNSVEADDSIRGACTSEITCIHCHNPHKTIGQAWPNTADQDDALCLECHKKYTPPEARAAHTHHDLGTEGSRCMNCHMPRLNEGIEHIVRTHMIYSPTRPDMILANQPNACNLCHVQESIDWTLGHLRTWYGAKLPEAQIKKSYGDFRGPATMGWLRGHQAVRLVTADALIRAKAKWALPELIRCLDDPYLGNRHFAQTGLEGMLDVELWKQYGYRHYMTPEERRGPIKRIRDAFLDALPDAKRGDK